MIEDVFKTIQDYLYDYCVDKENIPNKSRIIYDADNINYFDIANNKDVIVISSVNIKNNFLQASVEENYIAGGNEKYYDAVEEKIFIKYYGKFSTNKLFAITQLRRQSGNSGNLFLKDKNVVLQYCSNIKTIQRKINENLLEIAVQEAVLNYTTMSFANKTSLLISDVEFKIQ